MSVPPDPPAVIPGWELPTVDQVGALLRARTQDTNDQELGTFTPDTRPTADEVTVLIAQASNVVFNSTGYLGDLTCQNADTIKAGAQYLISLLAACLIELSYFPEQVRSNRSAFQEYYDIFTNEATGMPQLVRAVEECRAGEVTPDSMDGSLGASWAFPVDLGGLVGWQTKW